MNYPAAWRFSFLALLLLLVVDESGAQKLPNMITFRASAQMVLVPVTVTDHYGKTIEGLRAQDFNILDEQKPQRIVSFAREDAPCSVGMVLDISGSMRNILGPAKEVAQAFFGTANPQDEFLLLTVASQPEELSGFTTDIKALEESIDFTKSGGMTALVDTIYLGLNRMRKAHQPRRALLILSDGMDNFSRHSQSELMRVALEADTQIYTVILDNPSAGVTGSIPLRPSMIKKPIDQGRENEGPALLEKLSEKTGGLHFRARDGAQARQAVIRAAQAIRNQYVIGYQAPDSPMVGKWHRVRVKANVPNVNVYARNGYYSR